MSKDDIIAINQPDFAKVAEQLKANRAKASAVNVMVNSQGWKYIKEESDRMIDNVKEASIKGFKDWDTYKQRTEEARALQRILDIIDGFNRMGKSADDKLEKINK